MKGPCGKGLFMKGLFITIEGIDGCGKSTQSARLARWLEARTGREVLRTFEPGGWEGGRALRALILNGEVPDPDTELLLFLADRAGHLGSVVRPAIGAGKIVLCERYSDSTWAYQAGGRGLDPERVRGLLDRCGFLTPDLTLLLEIEPEAASARLRDRGDGRRDRIEAGGLAFMARVAEAYSDLARREPGRIERIPAAGSEEEVGELVRRAAAARLGIRQSEGPA